MAGLIRKISREWRRKKEEWKQQLALSVAAGMLFMPFSVQASEIAKQDGNLQNTVQQNGKVYNIYADKVNGDVAFSEYAKFNLSAGEIANMRFNTLNGAADVNNLINIVNSRINVDGTINAIRNNAVGGNLFFVSEKGMTVGAGGVINAGSINIIAPTGSAVDLIKEHFDETGDNGTKLPERLKNGYYAVNPSGTIQIAGKLNTVDGITMQAGTINIQNGAALKSVQSMNYSDVVNVSGVDSGITTPGTLTASENANGDIVLSAVAESTSATEEEREQWGTGLKEIALRERNAVVTVEEGSTVESRGAAKITAEASNEDDVWRTPDSPDSFPEFLGTVRNPLGQITRVSASVDIGGEVTGQSVTINASAYNQYNSLNDTSKWSDISGDIKNIDKFNQHYNWIKKASDLLGVDVMYSFMASDAKVDVRSTAVVTATGADIDTGKTDDNGNPVLSPALSITASSQVRNLLTAQTKTEAGLDYQKKDAKRAGEDYTGNVISEEYNPTRTVHYGSLSVVYGGSNVDAAVNIQGTVKAENGSAEIKANATNVFNVKSVVNTVVKSTTATDSRIDAAIGVAVTENNASVSVGENASVTAKKNLKVKAGVDNSHDMTIQAQASAKALVATALGVMEEQSRADVTLDGTLKADEGNLDIDAQNTLSRNNLSVTNSFTGKKPAPAAGDSVNGNGEIELEDENMPLLEGVDGILQDVKKDVDAKTVGTAAAASNPDTLGSLSKYFKAGASIGVAVENNDSKVSVGSAANISSGAALTIDALTDLQDTHMMSIGSLVNADPNATSLVNADAAALVTVFDNNAAITIADGSGSALGQHATISGGSVSMNAKVNEAYGRNKGVVNDFEKIYADLIAISDLVQDDGKEEYDKTVEDVGTAINDIRLAVKKMTGLDIDDYIGNTITIPTNATDAVLEVMALASGLEKFVASGKNGFRNEYNTITATINNNLMQFVRPETYVNFIAASSSNSVGAADPVFPTVGDISLAGAVNVNVLGNHAVTDVGKYAEIKAGAGQAAILSDAEQNTVAMNGRPNIDININPLLDLLYGNNSKEKRQALVGVNGKQGRLDLIKQVISVRPNSSGTNAIGGTVGVLEAGTESKINIGDYATVSGYAAPPATGTEAAADSILIKANDETVLTDITFGAGVSGKVGFEGMFGWLGGNIDTGVNMGQGVTIEAKSADTTPAYGNVRVESTVNAVMTNLVGEISITNGMAAGMSAGITDYSVDNIINMQQAAEDGAAQVPVTVQASGLDVAALTDGVINTIALAGTVAIDQNVNKNTEQNDKLDIIEDDGDERANEAALGADNGVRNGVILTDNPRQQNEDTGSAKDALLGKEPTRAPRLDIAGSGSVAVNIVNARTEANLNNIEYNVNNTVDVVKDINVEAEDASFVGAWSGSTAVTWKKTVKLDNDNQLASKVADDPTGKNAHRDSDGLKTKEKDANKSVSVAFAGAVAVNAADQTVVSSIRNSKLKGVADIRNTAEKDGALVAAGLAASVSKTTGSESMSFDGAASVSYNKGDGTVTALLENNSVNNDGEAWSGKTNIQNLAMISDTDVAGGIDLTLSLGGKYGFGAGGSLTVSDITNTLSAEAKGGTYYNIGTFQNHAAADLTAVATAVAASASVGSSGFNFDAALALNHLDNTAQASVYGNEGSHIVIGAGSVDVAAYDANHLNKSFDQYISDSYLDPSMGTYLQEVGSDVADKGGTDATKGGVSVDYTVATDEDGKTTADPNGYTVNPIDVSDGGTDIGTVALTISAGAKSAGANAAAAVGLISNDFRADVTNATITTRGVTDSEDNLHGLDVSANADSLLVNISGGVAASGGKFNGAGSVSVQKTEDTVSAVVEKSTVLSPVLDIEATTGNRNVNLAGQVSAGKNGGGLAMTYNSLNNDTIANLLSSNVSPAEDGHTNVSVAASNDGEVYSVAFGVGAGSTFALNGSIALNFGKDNLEARIGVSDEDKAPVSAISNAGTVSVTSVDDSRKLSVAGGVSGAGTAAVGGSVAYNELGDYSADEHHELKDKQVNRATIENTDITTDASGASVTVSAKDVSYLDTVSGAVGAAESAAVEGAASVSRLGRITRAEMSGTGIDKDAESRSSFANTKVSADSRGHIFNGAIMLAASGGASVGAGVSVMEDSADVAASLSDSTVHAGDLSVQAVTKDTAASIGVGGSGGMYAGVAGSVAVNLLNGYTRANIADSTVISENNVTVAAMSDTSLDNYAGTVTFAATGGAVGVSVSVNDIQNETSAGISGAGTQITAKSSGTAVKVADTVNDSEIIHDFVNTTDNMTPTYTLTRTDTEYKGIAVSSSATNKINSLIVNGGLVAEGGQVAGTVNVNLIGGKTEASVALDDKTVTENNSEVTVRGKLETGSNGDIAVVAHDYTNSLAFTGSFGIAGIGASIGLASNTNRISRDTVAAVTGPVTEENAEQITARALRVEAEAKRGIGSVDAGGAIAGIGGAVSNTDDVTLLSGLTKAEVSRINATLSGNVSVAANHNASIHTLSTIVDIGGIGADVGLNIDVIQDESNVETVLEQDSVQFTNNGSSSVAISAKNNVSNDYEMYSVGASGVGASVNGAISVGNSNSRVTVSVEDTSFGTSEKRAGDIAVTSDNTLTIKQYTWNNDISLIGGGEGLGVNVTTVDSTTAVSLADSRLYASGNIMVNAVENRSAHNLNGNTMAGGLEATGVNVSVMTVGKEVQDRYTATTYTAEGEKAEIDSGADLANAYAEGQDAVNGNTFQADYTYGYVAADSAATQSAVLGRGGAATPQYQTQSGSTGNEIQTSVVSASVSGGVLDSQQIVTVKSDAKTNAEIQAMSYGGGPSVSFSGSVAVLDAYRNAETSMDHVVVNAIDINAGSYLSGTTDMDIYQGGISGTAAGNGAFGFVDNGGSAKMNIGNSNTLTASGSINVEVDDTTDVTVDVFSVAASVGGAGGIQVSSLEAAGKNDIAIGGSNRLTASTISVNAKNTPVLKSHANGINASILIAGNVSVATAEAGRPDGDQHLRTSLTTGDGNVFNAGETGSVSLKATTAITTESIMKALDVSGLGSLLLNFNDSDIYSDTSVTLGKNTYVADNLTVSATTNATEDMNAAGVAVSVNGIAAFAVANNSQESENRISTTVSAAGTADESGETGIKTKIKTAEISSTSTVNVTGAAQSYGGSLTGIGTAAELDFDMDNNTTATLQGTWNLADTLKVSALNTETLGLGVDTTAAAIIDASAALLDSTVNQKAGVSVSGATVTTGGDQTYIANNQMTDNKLEVKASGYGGLDVAASNLDQNHTYMGTVDISNSNLSSDASIKAGSSVTGDFTTDNTVQAAGVVPLVFADSDHTTAYDNRVNVTDSNLKTTGEKDIILSASENTTLNFSTVGDNQFGLIGSASASVDNTLNRIGTVNVNGTSNLESDGGISFRAGKDLDGKNTKLDFRIVSDAYNSSIVPVAFSTELDNNMSQANTVTVGENVNGTSVGDIDITAYSGKTKLTQDAKGYNMWTCGDSSEDSGITVTTGNAYPENETVSNSVTVAGKLTAGIHNAASISISGNPSYDTEEKQKITELAQQYNSETDSSKKQDLEQQIKASAKELEDSFSYDSVSVNIEKGNEILSADEVTPATIILENGYYSRYEELKRDMQNSLGTEYYNNYAADMNSLMQEMIAAGFADTTVDNEGKTHYIVYKKREVAGINLPDMQVSGGDIRIDTPKLAVTESGSLTAKGNPEISVASVSELYLKVNDAIIVKEGGNVYLNDSGINSSTKEDGSFTGAKNIHAEKTDGASPLVSISNMASKTDELFTGDIGIYGKVINHAGDVSIANKNYSIYVTGEGSVAGRNVTIKAENGSVVQNKPEGAIAVGPDPVSQWVIDDETAQKIQEKLAEQSSINQSFKDYAEYRQYILDNCGITLPETQPGTSDSDKSHGIVAGGAVYISGHDVNLNGLVQSGYASYTATLDTDSLNKIQSLDDTYRETVLTDATVLSDSQFAVVNTGSHYDEYTDQYVYTPGIYYNPSTKKLVVDSITTNPGQVVITGNVISTGNGRVYAADGAAEISIDTTASDRDVQVNNLSVSSGSGLVSITDHLQNKVFEYQDGKVRSYTIGDSGNVTEETSSYFTPKDQTFQWTGSVSQNEIKTYSYTEETYVWGLWDKRTDDEIIAAYREDAKVTTVAVGGDVLNNGDYLKDYVQGKPSGIEPTYSDTERKVFGLYETETHDTEHTVKSTVHKDVQSDILWGVYKEVTYSWDETTPVNTSTQYVLRADQPVMVGALKTGGAGNISIIAGGGVSLSGNVSALSGGTVTLDSQKGSVVSSDGRVLGNQTDIRAASDINVLHSALAADDTASVKLASANGNITFDSNRGSLSIVQAESGNALGLAAITADRDIVNGASSGAAVQASRIELTSKTGGIGTADTALAIQAGTEPVSGNSMDASVSATADGNIFLAQTNGNMRIGYIESAKGNVTLTANDSFINAASNSDAAEAAINSRLSTWTDHGLISAADAADEKTNSATEAKVIREKAADVRANQLAIQKRGMAEDETYENYSSAVATAAGDYKTAAATLAGDYAAGMSDASQAYNAAVKEAQTVFDNSGKTEADKAALIDAYKNAFNAYAEARLAYFKSKGYDYSADEAQVVADYIGLQIAQGGWSKNNLLYAMREEIVNSVPGELPEYTTPNIKANTIIFTSGGIGENSAPVTINRADYENEDNLRLIASAQAGELTWNYKDGKVVSVTIRKETPVVVSTPDAGGVVVNSSGKQVYLATTSPVKDNDGNIEEGSTLHILGDINAGTANVKLQAGNGITVENENGEAGTIIAKDLILHAGQGDAGTTGKPIQTDITGTLDANSDKSVVIRQTGNKLTLKSVVAGDAIEITSDKGIEMAPTQSEEASGHLSAMSHINLTALGGVGKTEAIRVLANDVTVNVDAKDDTNIIGKVNGDDSLVLGTVTVAGGSFKAETDNDIAVGSMQVKNDITLLSTDGAITNSSTVTSEEGSINATAKSDITYNARIKAGNGIMLKSADGSIVSAPEDSVYLDAGSHLTLQAENGNLGSADNVLRIVNQKAAAIDATAQNAWLKGIANNAGNDTNIMTLQTVHIDNEFKAVSEGNILSASGSDSYLDVGTHVALQAENGNVGSADNALEIRNNSNTIIDATAKNAWLKGIANTSGENTDTMILQTIRVDNEFKAESEGNLKVKEATDENGATITSVEAGTVGLTAAKGISVDGTVTAEEDVTAEAKGDVLVNSTVDAKTATLTAGDDVIIDRAITVVSDFTAKAKGRIYETESGVLKTTGDKDQVELEAGRGIALENMENSFVRLNVHGAENESAPGTYNAIDGNVSVTVNGDREWKVIAPEITDADIPVKGILATIGSPVNGNVTLTNVGENATVVLYKNGIVTNSGEAGEGNVSIATDKAIVVTQGIQAANNVAVTSNTGHVFVKNSLTAKAGSANVSTGEGNIHIGANVASGLGTALTTGNGNIHIGANIVSGEDTALTTRDGNISIGANIASGQDTALTTGNGNITVDNLVVSNNGNVSLVTGGGDISIKDKVIAKGENVTDEDKGNVTVTTGEGNIHIGDNGENVKTVSADKKITLTTDLGKIHIKGGTESSSGDITMSAKSENYKPGAEGMNILLDGHGKVKAAGYVNLQSENGDVHVTGLVLSDKGLTADIQKQGSVYFDRSVAVSDNVVVTAQKGVIHVDNDVASLNGNITMKTTEGDVQVNNKVISDKGSVTVTTEKGNIHIGDNGENVKTVSADQNVALTTNLGKITIEGETFSKQGNITMSAKSDSYTPGSMNILIGEKGKVQAAGYVNLQAENGDLIVTDRILSGDGLTAEVQEQGSVYFGRDVDVKEKITIYSENGDIQTAGNLVAGNVVELTADAGSVTVLGGVTAIAGNVTATANDAITINKDVKAKQNVILTSENGAITAGLTVTAEAGKIEANAKGAVTAGDAVKANQNVTLTSSEGAITTGSTVTSTAGDIKAEANGDVTTKGALSAVKGSITATSATGNVKVEKKATAANDVTLTAEAGGVTVNGALTSTAGNIKAEGNGDVTTSGVLSAVKGAITATSAMGDVKVEKEATAANDVTLTAEAGSVTVNDAVTSTAGDVIATAGGDVTTSATATIHANKNVKVTSTNGVVQTGGALTAENESVTVNAKGNVTNNGAVQAKKDVTLTSTVGAVATASTVTAEGGNVAATAKGNITYNAAISANKEIALQSTDGNIVSAISLQAENGNAGSADNALRIQNNSNTSIDATAQNAWLKGIANTSGENTDTMTLQTIRVDNEFKAESEGNLKVKEATDENGATITSVEAGKVDLTAAKGIIVDGAVTAEDDVTAKAKGDVLINSTVGAKTATLTAGNDIAIGGAITVDTGFTAKAEGKIYETGSGVLQTKSNQDQVELEAGRGVALENKDNSFVRLNVHGTESASAPGTYNAIDGNVSITANGDRDWTVSALEFTDKDIPVKGILATVGSPVNGNVTLTNVGEDATVVLYKNGIVTNAGEAGKGDVSLTADKSIVVTQGIQAANDVSVTSNEGHVFVKNSLTAKEGSVNVSTGEGNIHIGANVASGQDTALTTGNGKITVDNLVASNNGNVSLTTGAGDISVNDKVIARTGSVSATTGEGDIHIGDNGPEENTVYAQQEVLLATDLGHIEISGRTLTQTGDITMKAGENTYVSGQSNFIINDNGRVESGWDVNLEGRNGDIHVTDDIVAQHSINTQIEGQGSVYFDDALSSNASISITSDQGDINVDKAITSVNGDVSLSTTSGNIRVDGAIKALNDVSVVSDTGNISLQDVTAGSDVSLEIRKSGDIKADNVSAGNLVHASVAQGDIFLDMASGKAVVIQSQANTPASHIGTIQAEAGGAGTDVAVTGNYINVGSILSKGGSNPLKVELEAPDGEEVISEVAIDNISSGSGTVIPKLWADRGTIHVSNGYLAIGDIYTTDKIHGDNPGTAFALYGRTPTGDGEPHMYWNNVDLPHRRTALLMTDSNVFTRMVDLLDEQTYTWLFERDYLKYVLAPEAPWAKHKGVLLYDRRHVVSGQRSNASEKELFSE